ncbi:hypothetical protein EV426DRAFT_662276 [Tirmania nivea]|nr:hypothetical protein EV426DRAFT_662276 [Tirmania nivea]
MATGMKNSSPGTFHDHNDDDTIRITPKKSNGTPIRSRIPTPTRSSRPGTATSTSPATRRTPAKNDSPKATVTDMMIVGHWDMLGDEKQIHLNTKGRNVEPIEKNAEFALFLRIIPLPGSTLEVLHLNKNMHLKLGSYRAIPLLPDGSCPREAPGPTALDIPIVEGRYHRTAAGKVKLRRRRPSESSSQADLVKLDGAYESDGELSNHSGDTVSSSVAAILSPEMFSDVHGDSTSNGTFGGDSKVDAVQAANEVDKWLENYNSGTRLTGNASGHICISFDENVRRDPLVVEIYLEAEPIKLVDTPPEDSSFVLASLPYCRKGINVSFHIESSSSDFEWVYDTKPVISDVLEIGENWFTGTYFTSNLIRDNTLVIRSHKVPRLQIPTDFTVDLITQVSPIPNPEVCNVGIIYRVKIIMNGTHPVEPNRRSTLLFKIYNLQADDKWDTLPDGAELDDYSEVCTSLEIVRPAEETFEDIVLTIKTQRNLSDLAKIKLPKFVAAGGIPIAETVLLEELGDQPIAYIGLDEQISWRKVQSVESPNIWTRAYYSVGNQIDTFSFGLVMTPLGFPLPGNEIEEEVRNDVVDIVSYSVVPIIDAKITGGRSLFTVEMAIRYETNSLAHNERVFTIASGNWRNIKISFNGTYGDGIFHACNEEKNIWIIVNNDYGRNGGPVLMESHWTGTGGEVFLTEDGEITSTEESDGMDKYLCLEIPYVMDKWVHVECKVQRGYHGIELNWLDASIPPRSSSLSPHRSETTASRSGTFNRGRLPFSPSRVYDDIVPSQTPGGSRGQTSGWNSSHMRRGTLKGEIHREEGLYVTRTGAKVFLYIAIEKRVRKTETVKKVPGSPPELKEEHSSSQGQVNHGKFNIGETPQGPVSKATGTNRVLNVSSVDAGLSNPHSHGVRSLQVQREVTTDFFESEPTVAPISETTSSDGVDKEGFTRNIATKAEKSRSVSCARCSSKKLQSKIISGVSSDLRPSTIEMPPLSKPPWLVWSVLQTLLNYILYMFLLCVFSILVFEAGAKISDIMDEISQVRNEMRAFQNVFQSVYGVHFGDARWRRVRIHQGGDVVVLVIGEAKDGGAMSVKKLLEGEAAEIHKDALWLEPNAAAKDADTYAPENTQRKEAVHRRNPVFQEGFVDKGSANWAEDEGVVDKDIAIKEGVEGGGNMRFRRKVRDETTPFEDDFSLAPWGDRKELRLYPWEHVREVVSYALEICEFIAEETKESVKDSWAKFLRAWRNVWYMT